MHYNNCQGPRHNDGPLVAGLSTLVNPVNEQRKKQKRQRKPATSRSNFSIVIGFLPFFALLKIMMTYISFNEEN